MKRVLLLFPCISCIVAFSAFAPPSFAQEGHNVQAGIYADYFRLSQTKTNFAGVGARLGFGAYKSVMLEAEMSYDFNQVFTESFSSGGTVTIQRTNTRVLHGLFGPKLELGHHSFHPFLTVKGGFNHFFLDNRPATVGTAISSIENLRSNDLTGVLYPGGGLEGHVGPIGLRLDVGDEIYFASGAHHNLRAAFGPYIRF